MANKYADTQTEKNLWAAFAGESQARNKYDYFAGVARKEGYQQIAELFAETAANERQHAKIWFKHLEGIGREPQVGRRRRKLRVDRYVRGVCQDRSGRRLS